MLLILMADGDLIVMNQIDSDLLFESISMNYVFWITCISKSYGLMITHESGNQFLFSCCAMLQ